MSRSKPNQTSRKLQRRSATRRHSGAEFQQLESRKLLAGITFNPATGIVSVDGSEAADSVLVSSSGTQLNVYLSNVGVQSYLRSSVTEVVFTARGGNDWMRNDTNVRVRAFGQAGADTLLGGSGMDVLNGGPDADVIYGNGGSDRLLGLAGDDSLFGGGGNDNLIGGDGNDNIQGEDGNDTLAGGVGDDYLDGGNGDDTAYGFDGRDSLLGGPGRDILAGQNGDDWINGGADDDSLYGNAGDDRLLGEGGNDLLAGNQGLDQLFGSLGDDSLYGGADDDLLRGDAGLNLLLGEAGNDRLFGGDDSDQLFGGEGDDDLDGASGNDWLRGGNGRDRLYGRGGSDDLGGDGDDDQLDGGLNDDRLTGGSGNDDYLRDGSDDLFDDNDDYSSNGDFEIRGVISNLDTVNKTFSLLGINVNYTGARIEGTLANGGFFKAEGAFASGVLTAHEVEAKQPGDSVDNFEAYGTVSSLNATTKTFQFNGLTVNYASAEVKGNVQDGALVKVEGSFAGGLVTAREVQQGIGDDGFEEARNFELRGAIANLDTVNKTFSLLGLAVNYSVGVVTANLANGAFVKVEGYFDGTGVLAREVQPELNDDRDENVELRGTVANLNTTAKTFEVLGILVRYDNADLRTSLANGNNVEIDGWFSQMAIDSEEIR